MYTALYMEKTVKFHVLKEKIIKTNELLQLHLDKTKELEKIQKCYQQLKTALELSKNEIKKLKLKNETLSYNLQLTEKNNAPLKDNYNILKQQYDQLEEESSKTINNLQINYQLASQELKECKEKLLTLSEQPFPIEIKSKSPVKRKKRVGPSVDGNVNQKVNQLLVENEKLGNENANLNLEIFELRKQVDNSQILKDGANKTKQIESKLRTKEQELLDLKVKLKISEDTKMEEINRLSKELKNVELGINKLKAENETLKNENCSYQIEISMLQEGEKKDDLIKNLNKIEEENKMLIIEINKLKDIIREDNNTPSDEQIGAIMNEIIPPTRLSPMSELNEEMLDSINKQLPPSAENVPKLSPTALKSTKSHVRSSSGNFIISAYSNYPKIIKSRNKKLFSIRKNKIIKRKSKKIGLFETLLALKKANMNFIISSDSLLYDTVNSSYLNNSPPSYTQSKTVVVPEKKYPKTVMCKLQCELSCCKNSHIMLLKGGTHGNADLLGFVNVKDESLPDYHSDNDKNSKNWPRLIPSHRSTKKRKKLENFSEKPQKKTSLKCNTNIEIQNKLDVEELETEHVALLEEGKPQEICDIKKGRSKRLENPKSVINNNKITRHSYGTRLSGLRQSVSDSGSPGGLKKIRIASVKKTKLVSVTKNCDQKIDENEGSLVHIDEDTPPPFPVISNPNVESSQRKKLVTPVENDCVETIKNRETLASNKIITRQKSPKNTFKRPVCRTRQSQRLVTVKAEIQSNMSDLVSKNVQAIAKDDSCPKCPGSPTPENRGGGNTPECPESPTAQNRGGILNRPKIIPLEPTQEKVEKIPTTKIEVLFVKLINYSMEEDVLNEVVGEFSNQDPEYIAQAILEKISQDYHDPPDNKYNPAPLMTVTQRTMLGFMSRLEKSNVVGVFDSYLTLAERKLLTCEVLQEFAPITRLYLAICKLHQNIQRMRKLCCDVFYFCGDFAVPFLFCVLTSWSEVLPHQANSNDMPLGKVLVQIVYMKDCNKPGYNLNPLRDLLIKFYGYPTERWDSNELFQELFHRYLRNPVRSSDFALLLLCKNHTEKWVHQKIEEHLKPIVDQIPSENFKAAVIILIGNLYNRFSSKSETNYLPSVRKWLSSLVTETTPDVVKRSVYLCLTRLRKK